MLWAVAGVAGAIGLAGLGAWLVRRSEGVRLGAVDVAGVLLPPGATPLAAAKVLPADVAAKTIVAKLKGQAANVRQQPAGVPTIIDEANGWTAHYIERAESATLEWGACFVDWSNDLGERYGETEAQERTIRVFNRVFDWALSASLVGWLARRICFRIDLPALKVRLSGFPLELWGPSRPSGLPNGTEFFGDVGHLNGWNPGTSRVGFLARWGKWPLKWPPPVGIGGAWIRNLGDEFGVGHDVFQMVTALDGEERSWPMMTRSGWRAVLRFAREYGFPVWLDGKNGPIEMFDAWSPEVPKRSWATRKKAMNRYK